MMIFIRIASTIEEAVIAMKNVYIKETYKHWTSWERVEQKLLEMDSNDTLTKYQEQALLWRSIWRMLTTVFTSMYWELISVMSTANDNVPLPSDEFLFVFKSGYVPGDTKYNLDSRDESNGSIKKFANSQHIVARFCI